MTTIAPSIEEDIIVEKHPFKKSSKKKEVPISCTPERNVTVSDAEIFISEIKNAGKRMIESKICFQQQFERQDQGAAIKKFMGRYDISQPHGTQLDNARRKAYHILKPAPQQSSQNKNMTGYVHGMPNPSLSKNKDLEARINNSIDVAHAFEASAKKATSQKEREFYLGVSKSERFRINEMKRQLSGNGKRTV